MNAVICLVVVIWGTTWIAITAQQSGIAVNVLYFGVFLYLHWCYLFLFVNLQITEIDG